MQFFIVAIDRPAEAGGRILRQVYPHGAANVDFRCPVIVRLGQQQHRGVSLFDLGIGNCATGIHNACTRQRNHSGNGPHIRSQQSILPNERPSERHAIALIVECGIDVRLAGVGEAMVPP